ncbi:hypothetical protein [Psychrobacillus sp. FSL K6-1267]
MNRIRRMLNAEVDVTMNGYALMGILVASLYGIFCLIRDVILTFI